MNARNVILNSQHSKRPFDIATQYGTVTAQRDGAFVYACTIGGHPAGVVFVNRPGTETLYTASSPDFTTEWHRDTLEDCAEMLALAHLEATQ